MRGLQFLLTRSVWLLSGTALLLLAISLGLLMYVAWHNIERIRPLERHLNYVVAIELSAGDVRTQLVNLLESQNDLDPGGFEALREQLNALRASDAFQMETTPAGIDHALTQLVQFDGHSRTPLDGASSGPARRVEPVAARSQAPGQRFPVRRPA